MPRQRGSALISALLIMSLIAMLVVAMTERVRLEINRTQLMLERENLILNSQVVTFWAIGVLTDLKQNPVSQDPHGKIMRFPNAFKPNMPGSQISGSLYDLQARFNLNNITESLFVPMLYGLLEQNVPGAQLASSLLHTTLEWIRPLAPNAAPQKNTSTPHHALYDLSELRLIPGITASLYRTLKPMLTTLPTVTPINLNTAPPSILKALGRGLSTQESNELFNARGKQGIQNMNQALSLLGKFNIPQAQISLDSHYFLVIAHSQSRSLRQTTVTVLERRVDPKGQVTITCLSQAD